MVIGKKPLITEHRLLITKNASRIQVIFYNTFIKLTEFVFFIILFIFLTLYKL